MPNYTFECENCGFSGTVFAAMAKAPKVGKASSTACPACAKKSYRRVYAPQNVVDDFLPDPVKCFSLRPLEGDTRKVPVVQSRSELKRLIEGNNQKYGKNLVQAG